MAQGVASSMDPIRRAQVMHSKVNTYKICKIVDFKIVYNVSHICSSIVFLSKMNKR